jgi:hypothetical protein
MNFLLSVHETTLKRLQVRVQDRDEKKQTWSVSTICQQEILELRKLRAVIRLWFLSERA